MAGADISPIVQTLVSLDPGPADLWISAHGYESRSTAHLELLRIAANRRVSFGFSHQGDGATPEIEAGILRRRQQLQTAGYETPIVDDSGFDAFVSNELFGQRESRRLRVIADISSMSRARMATLILTCSEVKGGCDLDLVYFVGSFASHKHAYEPLEYFGPCHPQTAGWADDSQLPLSVLIGLGTEPSRAEGVVETIEPDILALFVPVGDEMEYSDEIWKENRQLLEVAGEPVNYPVRDPAVAFSSLQITAARLAERSRLIIVPLGPKIFCALSLVTALSIGSPVGVWKASAGKGVQAIDVKATDVPIFARLSFRNT
jgi:hypothetical protein